MNFVSRTSTIHELPKPLHVSVIGNRMDFLNADDQMAAKNFDDSRPGLTTGSDAGIPQWIYCTPTYYPIDKYRITFLADNTTQSRSPSSVACTVDVEIWKLAQNSRQFPDAPVRQSVVTFDIAEFGKPAYLVDQIRVDAVDVFGMKDPETLTPVQILQAAATYMDNNASRFKTAIQKTMTSITLEELEMRP